MALIYENELKRQIKDGKMNNCYLFYGDEDYLKQFYLNKIISKFVTPGSETFSLRKYDGKDDTLEDVFEGAQSISFMTEFTVVVAHDFKLNKPNEDEKEQISAFLDNQPDSSITIFWFDAEHPDSWILEQFKKKATAVNFRKPDLKELYRLIIAYAKKQGCVMQEKTAHYLIETVGDDLNTLFNEIQKAANFAGNGNEIKKEDIDSVAIESLEANVFNISKNILAGNPGSALELLHTLMQQKAEAIEILAVIIMSFSDIYRAKIALDAGKNARYMADFYDYKNKEFRLTNVAGRAARLTMGQIRECFDRINESDRALKFSSQNDELVLEKLIVNLSLIVSR